MKTTFVFQFASILIIFVSSTQAELKQCSLGNEGNVVCIGVNTTGIQNFLQSIQSEILTLKVFDGTIGTFDSNTIPESAANTIKEIVLFKNNITLLISDALKNFHSLETFVSNTNPINIVEAGIFENVVNLTEISLIGSNLTTINQNVFWNLNRLKSIQFSASTLNAIPEQSFKNLPNLEIIDFQESALQQISPNAFVNLPKLKQFVAPFAHMKQLNAKVFADLPAFNLLELSNNFITEIDQGVFDGSSAVEYLLFDKNELDYVEANWFVGMRQLIELHLDNNRLTDLNVTSLAAVLPPSVYITLGGNLWKCDNLLIIFEDFNKTHLVPDWGITNYNVKNYNGVPCY